MTVPIGSILHYIRTFVKFAQEIDEEATNKGGGDYTPYQPDNIQVEQYLQDIDNKSFQLSTLKDLSDPSVMSYYLESLLPPVSTGKGGGEGSGRRVYDLGDERVVKFAYLTPGVYQNEKEASIYSSNSLFADVYDSGSDYYWIIAEKIYPFKSIEDFSSATGVPEYIASKLMPVIKMDDFMLESSIGDIPSKGYTFLKKLRDIYDVYSIIAGDLADYRHWGVNSSGEVKIFDYGLDKSGAEKFYEKGVIKQEPPKDEKDMLARMGIPPQHYDLGVRVVAKRIDRLKKIIS